jgi:hypothetical protein
MLTKIVTLFLVFIAVLGIFGKLYWLLPRRAKKKTAKCAKCGRHLIGPGPCDCERG